MCSADCFARARPRIRLLVHFDCAALSVVYLTRSSFARLTQYRQKQHCTWTRRSLGWHCLHYMSVKASRMWCCTLTSNLRAGHVCNWTIACRKTSTSTLVLWCQLQWLASMQRNLILSTPLTQSCWKVACPATSDARAATLAKMIVAFILIHRLSYVRWLKSQIAMILHNVYTSTYLLIYSFNVLL